MPFDCFLLRWHFRDQGPVGFQDFLRKFTWPAQRSISKDYIFEFPKDGIVITQSDMLEEAEGTGTFERVGDILKVAEKNIELADGRVLGEVHMILCATGYTNRFPILEGMS